MKRNKQVEKLTKKRQAWLTRTAAILDIDEHAAQRLLTTDRRQSLRLNTLKATPQVLTTLPVSSIGDNFTWLPEGYRLNVPVANIRDHHTVISGQVFIQNAASWLPVLALEPKPAEAILDVCAAPGGKTSHIAAITDNQARITANDNSRTRLAKLRGTLERLGATADYTLFDATQLTRKLTGQEFDRILIDAPCSGEGLMHFDRDKDFATWSVAHIKRLQQLQRRILTQAWQLLKPGGTLVYSTCTMAPEENEAVIDYFLRSRDEARTVPINIVLPNRVAALTEWNGKLFDAGVRNCLRLAPSPEIEAFFVCKVQKIEP